METTKFLLKNQLAVHTLGYEGSPEGGDPLVLATAGGMLGMGPPQTGLQVALTPPPPPPAASSAAGIILKPEPREVTDINAFGGTPCPEPPKPGDKSPTTNRARGCIPDVE